MHWITSSVKQDILLPNEIYFPLLDITYFKPNKVENCDIAIFTSQHGIVGCNFEKAFVVGDKTAKKIDKSNVIIFKNVAQLKTVLFDFFDKKIIYFRGKDVTDDLSFLSKNNNFISKITYEANAITELSNEIINLLKDKKINQITVYSKRSYGILKYFIEKYNLDKKAYKINFLFKM